MTTGSLSIQQAVARDAGKRSDLSYRFYLWLMESAKQSYEAYLERVKNIEAWW